MYRIQNNTSRLLLQRPETGMGYQVISFRDIGIVIFNATTAIYLNELRSRNLTEEEYDLISENPNNPALNRLENLELSDNFEVFSIFNPSQSGNRYGLSYSETAIEPSKKIIPIGVPRSYYRFSAYYNDKRIDPITGNFLPGTYATTFADMHFVPSGFAAVGRYALPVRASARYISQIVTYDRPTLIGTVKPDYGQAGGGVEVFFQNGAKNQPGSSFRINEG